MEISNFSQSTIPLVVGSRVAQIVFFYTGKVMNPYENRGAYQQKYKTFDELMSKWQVILPKYRM